MEIMIEKKIVTQFSIQIIFQFSAGLKGMKN